MALTEDQKTQLLAVYDKAKSEGDTAAMERIKGAFAQDRAPAADTADRRGDAPPNTFVDPATGQPTNPAPLQPFSDIARQGIAEPAIRAAEGVGDAVGQFARSDAQAGYKQMVDARRAQFAKDNPGTSEGLEDFGAGVVSSALPIGAMAKTTTGLMAAGQGALTGGLASDLQYTPAGQSKAAQVGFGAGTGGLFGAFRGLIPAAKNIVTRAITEAEGNPRVKEVMDAASNFFGGSKAVSSPSPYSIGQSTASPTLQRLEGRAFGTQQQELGAKQADEAKARFSEIADQASAIAKQPATSQDVAAGVNKALNTTVQGLRTERSNAFKSGMTNVLKLDSAVPAPLRVSVPLTNLQDAYETVLQQDQNAFNVHGETLPQGIQNALAALKSAAAGGTTAVRIPTLQVIMQGLGQDAQHGAGTFLSPADMRLERYRGMLFDGLQKDIDAAGVTAGKNPAYAALKDVRKTYAQQSDALRQIENDSITKLFGSPEAVQNPAQALDKFYALKPDDQKFAINLLNNNSPGTVEAMRAHQIRTALQDASMAGNAKNSQFDLAAFNESMFGQGRGSSPLWKGSGTTASTSDVTASAVRAGAAHLRVLLNATQGGGGSVVGPEDLAINAISMNPAFLARVLTRAVYGTKGDVMLGTKEGLEALRTLSNTSNRNTQSYAAAVSLVTNLARQGGGPSVQSGQ